MCKFVLCASFIISRISSMAAVALLIICKGAVFKTKPVGNIFPIQFHFVLTSSIHSFMLLMCAWHELKQCPLSCVLFWKLYPYKIAETDSFWVVFSHLHYHGQPAILWSALSIQIWKLSSQQSLWFIDLKTRILASKWSHEAPRGLRESSLKSDKCLMAFWGLLCTHG